MRLSRFLLLLVSSLWMTQVSAGSVNFIGGVVPFFTMVGSPTGAAAAFSVSDEGRTFTLTPTDNLVGADRWVGNDTNGIAFGGGGGSTTEFVLEVDGDVELDDYIIGGGFKLNNPVMTFLDGVNPVGTSGAVNVAGTFAFPGGSLLLSAGTSYTVNFSPIGAGVQSALAGFNFTPVPVPGALVLLVPALLSLGRLRSA